MIIVSLMLILQGVWRYVVQIPYEGYFTQTVEVVKCLSNKCQFLQGSCLASPRWVSLLVAEIYYPDTFFPTPEQPAPGRDPIKVTLSPMIPGANLYYSGLSPGGLQPVPAQEVRQAGGELRRPGRARLLQREALLRLVPHSRQLQVLEK